MKIALKYGLIIAAVVAFWVLADHLVLHTSGPGSRAAFLTPLVLNLVQLSVIFFGIRAWRQHNNGRLTVRQGIGSGLSISVVYAVLICIFFLVYYLWVGPRLLENEPASIADDRPAKYVLLAAFAGLSFGALLGGLIYSAVISFALRTQPQGERDRRTGPPSRQSRRRR